MVEEMREMLLRVKASPIKIHGFLGILINGASALCEVAELVLTMSRSEKIFRKKACWHHTTSPCIKESPH